MKILFIVFSTLLALLFIIMPIGITAEETALTPSELIKTLEVIDLDPEDDRDNERIWVVFEGDNLQMRNVVIENVATDYFSGLRIFTLPVPPDKESEAWSLISYEIQISGEQPNLWRTAKNPKFRNAKQHIWFVFKINMLIPTNELAQYIKDYQTKPSRKYEGNVGYEIFKVRKDIKAIPMEDFMQGTETLYVEIDIDITRIDGKKLKKP